MATFCYAPGVTGKPSIAIVGAGNLGTALAVSLRRAGFTIPWIASRAEAGSLRRARALAREVGAKATSDPVLVDADVVWFCVPDSEIAGVAEEFARSESGTALKRPRRKLEASKLETSKWKGTVALHASGALTSDELEPLRRKGAGVASVHPFMTFVKGSRPSLAGVPFALEGDRAATRVAGRIVGELAGQIYSIRKKDKAAYHAWATFASPLFTALLATTERAAAGAGVRRGDAARRMIPILLQTLANYARFGPAAAFSGPIIRGDAETVSRHLQALRRIPEARRVYAALAQAALEYLPAKSRTSLRRVLVSALR